MNAHFVRIGSRRINIDRIMACSWNDSGATLYVRFALGKIPDGGGEYVEAFFDDQAKFLDTLLEGMTYSVYVENWRSLMKNLMLVKKPKQTETHLWQWTLADPPQHELEFDLPKEVFDRLKSPHCDKPWLFLTKAEAMDALSRAMDLNHAVKGIEDDDLERGAR